MTVYLISGLGADERIFARLQWPEGIEVRHVQWIEPLPKETLATYCRRLSEQIDTNVPYCLGGLSFGGLVAIELAKQLSPKLVLLFSSMSSDKGLPFHLQMVRLLKLHLLAPSWLMKTPTCFAYWFFGARTQEERVLLDSFMRQVSPTYLKWSIHQVLHWKQPQKLNNLVHIHGTADRIFPANSCGADHTIKDGGHLMVHDKAEAVSQVLQDIFEKARSHK